MKRVGAPLLRTLWVARQISRCLTVPAANTVRRDGGRVGPREGMRARSPRSLHVTFYDLIFVIKQED